MSPRLDAEALRRHYNTGESSRIEYYLDVEAADRRSFAEVLDRAERLVEMFGSQAENRQSICRHNLPLVF